MKYDATNYEGQWEKKWNEKLSQPIISAERASTWIFGCIENYDYIPWRKGA